MFKKVMYLFFILLLILTIQSCVEDEAQKLIDSSVSTCNLLNEYYDKLVNYTIESWELEAFNCSLREINFSSAEQEEFQKTIEHLQSRKKVIESFSKTLKLLEDFVKNKSGDDFKKNLTELGNNINELKPLKDNKVILPSNIFGNLASDIIEIYKFFEIKYISKTLANVLEKIKELYEKESELYSSIIEERNNKSLTVIYYMIDNEMVVPWSLIESAPGTVGLEIAGDNKPAKDDKTKRALKKVLDVKYYRFKYLNKEAEESLNKLLLDLINSYNDFIQGKNIIFENIAYTMMKSASYLNDINEYYKTITGTNNNAQEEEIIYRGNNDTKVFHQPNCQYYSSKNCTVIFRSRDEAVKKGYVPCNTCKP